MKAQTQQPAHTKGEWNEKDCKVFSEQNQLIADCNFLNKVDKANAKRIVKACNLHDQLVDALKEIKRKIGNEQCGMEHEINTLINEMLEKAELKQQLITKIYYMFNQKNLLYYSTNEELDKPAPESENDFQGELHTATSVIAKVEDEEGAQEIVKRVNMHDELVELAKNILFENEIRIRAKLQPITKTVLSKAEQLIKQAEGK